MVDESTATAAPSATSSRRSSDAPASPFGTPADPRQLVGEFDDQLRRLSDGSWRIARREARFVLHAG